MPPPAEGIASRLIVGPTLRTQSDGRLVALVRAGYESAFEEIVRRYGKPLSRYAAAIVGTGSEDVTQDAFSKAHLALCRNDAQIELRPWLFRIVRNTALNHLRDRPPTPEALAEAIASGRSPEEEVEQREELTELMRRLRALPEPQRAAIVMRELEGLSHEEIAAALGLTGGAARQVIYRARCSLRDGLGMLIPLPLLRAALAIAAEGGGPGEVAVGGGVAGATGAGVGVKAALATVLVAGTVGAGVALHEARHTGPARIAHAVERHDAPAAASAGGPSRETAVPAVGGTVTGAAGGGGRGRAPGEPGAADGARPGTPTHSRQPLAPESSPDSGNRSQPMSHDTGSGGNSGSPGPGSESGDGSASNPAGSTSGESGSGSESPDGSSSSGSESTSGGSESSDGGSGSDGGEAGSSSADGESSTSSQDSGESSDLWSSGGLIQQIAP